MKPSILRGLTSNICLLCLFIFTWLTFWIVWNFWTLYLAYVWMGVEIEKLETEVNFNWKIYFVMKREEKILNIREGQFCP